MVAVSLEPISTAARVRFDSLLEALAKVFEAEGCPGGDLAARECRNALGKPYRRLDESTELGPVLEQALDHPGALPIARLVGVAGDMIPWHYSGLSDNRIHAPLARRMQTSYLIGPDGAIEHDSVWVGLFLQSPHVDYPVRVHAAEETFYVISGTGEWQVGDAPARPCPPGSYVQHPSYAPHASRTGDEPVLAAWRWTGEIGLHTYELKG